MTLEGMSQEELEAAREPEDAGAGEGSRGRLGISRSHLAEAKRTRAFWLLLFFVIVERFALGFDQPAHGRNFEDRGLPMGLAVSTLSIFAATSALTGLPWGFAFEHIHVRFGAMMMSGLLVLSMVVLIVADNYLLAVTFALLFGLAIGAGNIVEQLLWADYFGREHLGAIRGFGAPFRIASPTGPVLTGLLFDWTGSYTVPFTVFAVIFSIMTVAMFFATPPEKPTAPISESPRP